MLREFEPTDVYIAACLMPFSSRRAGLEHEAHCPRCQSIIRGEDEEEKADNDEEGES